MHNPLKKIIIIRCLYKPIIKKKRKIMPIGGFELGCKKNRFRFAVSDSGETNWAYSDFNVSYKPL